MLIYSNINTFRSNNSKKNMLKSDLACAKTYPSLYYIYKDSTGKESF